MSETAQATDDGPEGAAWLFRSGAIAGGVCLVLSYVLAWAEVVGLTRERGTGPEQVAVGSEAVLRQQGFQDNTGATIAGTDVALFPAVVAALGILVVVVAALRWRLATQAIASFFGLLAVLIGVFFLQFLNGSGGEFIQVGTHEGPTASFEPGLGLWLVLLCGVSIIVFGVGGAVYDHRQA